MSRRAIIDVAGAAASALAASAVPPNSTTLPLLVAKITRLRAEVSAAVREANPADFAAWHTHRRVAEQALAAQLAAELGAKIDEVRHAETRVKIAGITATSTGGLLTALGNWCAAAERKAA